MKIFISWSGERSKHIATTFHYWLKRFSPAIEPWVSSLDIRKGFSWDSIIAKELNSSSVGLICLTSDNLSSPFLHYEAGAISNVKNSEVYTFLFDVQDIDVKPPLSRFQNTKFEKADILQLIRDINFKLKELGESAWSDEAIDENFELLYPSLEEKLKQTPPNSSPKKARSVEDMLEELLRTNRAATEVKSRLPAPLDATGTVSKQMVYDFLMDMVKNNEIKANDLIESNLKRLAIKFVSQTSWGISHAVLRDAMISVRSDLSNNPDQTE